MVNDEMNELDQHVISQNGDFELFRTEDGNFMINTDALTIEFPSQAVVLRINPHSNAKAENGASMSVKWGFGHQIHFTARLAKSTAYKISRMFPELQMIHCPEDPIRLI